MYVSPILNYVLKAWIIFNYLRNNKFHFSLFSMEVEKHVTGSLQMANNEASWKGSSSVRYVCYFSKDLRRKFDQFDMSRGIWIVSR